MTAKKRTYKENIFTIFEIIVGPPHSQPKDRQVGTIPSQRVLAFIGYHPSHCIFLHLHGKKTRGKIMVIGVCTPKVCSLSCNTYCDETRRHVHLSHQARTLGLNVHQVQ